MRWLWRCLCRLSRHKPYVHPLDQHYDAVKILVRTHGIRDWGLVPLDEDDDS